MDLSFITSYFVPVVMAGCLATGYVVKKWIKDVDNKYIPTIVFIEGAILNCIVMNNITVETNKVILQNDNKKNKFGLLE